jgi:hypothetical protein
MTRLTFSRFGNGENTGAYPTSRWAARGRGAAVLRCPAGVAAVLAADLAWDGGDGQDNRMSSYTDFFVGSAGVAGALTGLLFVSLSVNSERLTGKNASVELQSTAATAFTALVDALWISLFALRPGNNIPIASLVLGLIGLSSTAGLTIRLWQIRHQEKLSSRWPFLRVVIIGLYAYQVSTAFTAPGSEQALSDAATLVFVFFGVGLVRAWELLGLHGGGLLELLVVNVRRAGAKDGAGPDLGESPRPGPAAGP